MTSGGPSWRRGCGGSVSSASGTSRPSWPGRAIPHPLPTSTRPRSSGPRRLGWLELDHVPVDSDFPDILEIDRDTGADHRLDLPQAPVRPAGMADEVARGEGGWGRFFAHRVGNFPF